MGSSPEKVADRPHPVTVRLAVLGPIAALVAIGFSFCSYTIATDSLRASQNSVEISQQSLRLGQRAYLAIRNGRFFYREGFRLLNPPPSGWDNDVYWVTWSFDIVNLGNTPADLTSLSFETKTPSGWGYRADDNPHSWHKVGYVGPHDSLHWSTSVHVNIPPDAIKGHFRPRIREHGAGLPLPGNFEVSWRLIYLDVFNDSRNVEWCWADAAQSVYPAACAKDYEGRMVRPERAQ